MEKWPLEVTRWKQFSPKIDSVLLLSFRSEEQVMFSICVHVIYETPIAIFQALPDTSLAEILIDSHSRLTLNRTTQWRHLK